MNYFRFSIFYFLFFLMPCSIINAQSGFFDEEQNGVDECSEELVLELSNEVVYDNQELDLTEMLMFLLYKNV